MQVQVSTDNRVSGSVGLQEHVEGVVAHALRKFSDQITRVEVHLGDENSHKGGPDDKRCMMEARFQGRQPTAVTHHASSLHLAIDGAADKLKRAVESDVAKLREHRP